MQHSNPHFWKTNPCLHYHIQVWRKSSTNLSFQQSFRGVDAANPDPDFQILLNLTEMWRAFLFQSLQYTELPKFLPEGAVIHAGKLNVALPL